MVHYLAKVAQLCCSILHHYLPLYYTARYHTVLHGLLLFCTVCYPVPRACVLRLCSTIDQCVRIHIPCAVRITGWHSHMRLGIQNIRLLL